MNERHGHLAGDEVLRRVGRALRHSVRGYDLVGRYGGDEFAIVAVDADEREAAEVATRAIAGVERALGKLDYTDRDGGATAGVAEWHEGEGVTALIERADRALRFGKQQRRARHRRAQLRAAGPLRPGAPGATSSPAGARRRRARLERARPRADGRAAQADAPAGAGGQRGRRAASRRSTTSRRSWRRRSTRCSARSSSPSPPIVRVRDDGYVESVAMRGVALRRLGVDRWAQPVESGLIGRCVRERRAVLSGDVRSEPDYRLVPGLAEVRSELATPIWVAGKLWGAIDIEEVRADAFDDDDVRLMQTIADQVGAALRATRVAQVDARASRAPRAGAWFAARPLSARAILLPTKRPGGFLP